MTNTTTVRSGVASEDAEKATRSLLRFASWGAAYEDCRNQIATLQAEIRQKEQLLMRAIDAERLALLEGKEELALIRAVGVTPESLSRSELDRFAKTCDQFEDVDVKGFLAGRFNIPTRLR